MTKEAAEIDDKGTSVKSHFGLSAELVKGIPLCSPKEIPLRQPAPEPYPMLSAELQGFLLPSSDPSHPQSHL